MLGGRECWEWSRIMRPHRNPTTEFLGPGEFESARSGRLVNGDDVAATVKTSCERRSWGGHPCERCGEDEKEMLQFGREMHIHGSVRLLGTEGRIRGHVCRPMAEKDAA